MDIKGSLLVFFMLFGVVRAILRQNKCGNVKKCVNVKNQKRCARKFHEQKRVICDMFDAFWGIQGYFCVLLVLSFVCFWRIPGSKKGVSRLHFWIPNLAWVRQKRRPKAGPMLNLESRSEVGIRLPLSLYTNIYIAYFAPLPSASAPQAARVSVSVLSTITSL